MDFLETLLMTVGDWANLALAFEVPLPDLIWGGALLLTVLVLLILHLRSGGADQSETVLAEHHRMSRRLRAREIQLDKEKRRIKRAKRDQRSF